MNITPPQLHFQTVTPFMLQILEALMGHPALASFQLAGGTSIALLTGHRQSIDLDLFTNQAFDPAIIDIAFRSWQPLSRKQSPIGLAYQLPAPGEEPLLKVDLCNWRTPFLFPPIQVGTLRLTDLRDSCADKLNAITDRNELKDIWDIGELLKQFSLAEMVAFYRQKHPFLDAKEPLRALNSFEYNQPVAFRVYNGETIQRTRQRIEIALATFTQKQAPERTIHIPDDYRQKLAQKGISTPKANAPEVPRRKRPRL